MPTASSKSTPAEPSNGARPGRRRPRLFPAELFLITAPTREALRARMAELQAYLSRPAPARLHDLAFTVSQAYDPSLECVALVAASHADLAAKLARAGDGLAEKDRIHDRDGIYYASERLGTGKVAFLFPGENAQYRNMLRELCLSFPEVREAFDLADAACMVEQDGFLPSGLNFPAPGQDDGSGADEMAQWEKAVVLVHTANTAMSRLLGGLEIRPDAAVGHSFGELSALEMAGVLRGGEGAERIRFANHAYLHLRELSQERDLPVGRLLAVGGADRGQIDQVLARFPDSLRVAMENCPHQYVLCASGPRMEETIAEAERSLSSEGALCSLLPIRRPYHSSFFEPAFPLEKAYYEEVGVHPPKIEVYSCATTEPFPSDPEAIVEVAARHWMSGVRFQATIEKMYERGFRVFVDVGPRGNLCAFVGDILKGRPHLTVALNRPQRSDVAQLLNAVATLAAHGVPLRVHPLHEPWGSRVVALDGKDEAVGKGKKRSLELPLFTEPPTLKVTGLAPLRSRPAVSVPPAEPDRDALLASPEPAGPLASVPLPAMEGGLAAPAPREESDTVMLSYLGTMERFVASQGTLMASLLRPAPGPALPEPTARLRPLLGAIEELVPGESLVARRVLDVEEDQYLKDHALGTSVSATDPSLFALPVMPVTFSLEVAAEAAAALCEGSAVVALEDIRAYRWIFLDQGRVPLRVTARRTGSSGPDARVHVTIQEETSEDPKLQPTMVEVTVLVAAEPKAPLPSRLSPLPPSTACRWTGTEIYPTRTFHGPRFQGLKSIDRWSEEGVDGTLEVLPPSGLLRAVPDPELELDPVLIDMLGQAVLLWSSREPFQGQVDLPFGASAVRCYGPRLPPGSRLDLRLRVRARDAMTTTTDIEAVDARGHVRLALEQLSDRKFAITPALHRLMLKPLDHHFAEVRALDLPVAGEGRSARVLLASVAAFPLSILEGAFGVWRKALAFLVLGRAEREEWQGRQVPLLREIQWLLGRAAAKDALRALVRERGGPRLGSADLVIRNEPGGRPVVAGGWPAAWPDVPQISISHTEGMVMAVAAGGDGVRVGVDTEKVRPPSPDLLDGAFSVAELGRLPGATDAERAEWVFRSWCAKEALGKAWGTGVPMDPRELEVTAVDPAAGMVTIRRGAEEEVRVSTMRMEPHVAAVAVLGSFR